MQSPNRSKLRRKSGFEIGPRVRELRQARRLSQAELAAQLDLSQARLSEIERGAGSFSAEQFIHLLKLFNVGVAHFDSDTSNDEESALQQSLSRLGARHLLTGDTLPSDNLVRPSDAIRATLLSGSPRLVAALAPVLLRTAGNVSLPSLHDSLADAGYPRRLPWLVDSVLDAAPRVLAQFPSQDLVRRIRTTSFFLESFRDAIADRAPGDTDDIPRDILDPTIRSKSTLTQVWNAASPIARRWHIVTRLQPTDFIEATLAADVVL